MNGIGSHQSAKMISSEWLTPPYIVRALGEFDLDPCSPVNRPWDTAKTHWTKEDSGMSKPWFGRVWLNPPYGKYTGAWLKRAADHGNAIAMIFARTETEMFYQHVWLRADALFFFKGRLHFYHVNGERANGNSGAPSVLVAYGISNAEWLKNLNFDGAYVDNFKVT